MELIKNAISWGNSSGVLLPREWKVREVKVILIERTLDIKKEVFKILEPYLQDVLGIYLVGSHAREEQTERSDIDILVITEKTNKRLEEDKYNLLLISKKEVEAQLKRNVLPLLPMLKEAKPLLNSGLVEEYKNAKLTKKNLKFHIETTRSAMKVVKKDIEIAKQTKGEVGDASAYSLILRLRTLYIIECIMKNKKWSNREFIKLIKKISGSREAYERYFSAKNKNTLEYKLAIKEAEKLMSYINKEVELLKKNLG